MTDRQEHWNRIYGTRGERDVSWFEDVPSPSLELLDAAGLHAGSSVIDVGGGESRLVDALLARGVGTIAVLDVSAEALAHARARLGEPAARVQWITADVTGDWATPPKDIWHDRAVFHFLTDPADRRRYVERLRATVKPGGAVIIATFAPDGPETCSGLPVMRYSPDTLATELGHGFALVEHRAHRHTTPWGAVQSFQYSRFSCAT